MLCYTCSMIVSLLSRMFVFVFGVRCCRRFFVSVLLRHHRVIDFMAVASRAKSKAGSCIVTPLVG